MNLRIPMILSDGESAEHCEVGILPASSAVIGELLRIDLNDIELLSMREGICALLCGLLAPEYMACGKFGVVFEKDRKSVIVLTRDAWLNCEHSKSFEMANVNSTAKLPYNQTILAI